MARQSVNLILRDFKSGTVTLVAESRMPQTAVKQSLNFYQTQDGIWTTRPGTASFGTAIPGLATTGTIDGFQEYVVYNSDGTNTNHLIVVANGVVNKSLDSGKTWTTVTGATFTAGVRCFFLQVKNRLYITNGTDLLSYYDGTVMNTYTAIANPGVVTPTLGAGLSSGSNNNFYQVVALNTVGYSQASAQVSITTNILRVNWTPITNGNVTLSWGAVTGATRYDVYYGDTSGYLYYIGSTNTPSYTDNGSSTPNQAVVPPLDNTTAAPKFKQMELSGQRIWATGDSNNPYRVYFSGTGVNIGTFSPFYGGGYIDLESGGRNIPSAVVHYRDGKGTSLLTCLTTDPEGNGTTWQISLLNVTVGTVSINIPSPDKVVGSIGSNAPYGVVKAKDAIIFPNSKGFFRLGSVQQLLNLLSTDELSANIRPDVRSWSAKKFSTICGYYYLGKLYYSIPTADTGNDTTVIYDLEHNNWQLGWNIGFSQFGEFTDTTTKKTYLIAAPTTGNKLVQISENITGDSGKAFSTSLATGLIPVSSDRRLFAKIKWAYIELYNPTGTITFELLGTEKKKGFKSLGTKTISDTISQTGLSWEKLSTTKLSTSSGTPKSFSQSTIKKRIRVNRLLNNVQFHVSSTDINTKYTVLSFQAIGYIVRTRDPQSWTS